MVIDVGAKRIAADKLKRIGAAQIEAYRKLDDVHITNPAWLNAIREIAPTQPAAGLPAIAYDYLPRTALQAVVTRIDGVPPLPHNFAQMSYEDQMGHLMGAISERVKREGEKVRTTNTRTSVDTQIAELTDTKRELTTAQQAEKKRLKTEREEFEKTQTAVEDHAAKKKQISEIDEDIKTKEAEIPDVVTADNGLQGKKDRLVQITEEQKSIDDEIKLLTDESVQFQKEADGLNEAIAKAQAQITALNQSNAALGGVAAKQNQVVYQAAQIIQLEGLITHLNPQRNRLQGRIAGHQARLNVGRPQGRPPQESLNSRKRNTETRLKQLTKEITDDEAVLANSENKTKLEAIKAQRKKKTQTEAALRIIEERVGTKQPDGTYRLPDAEKLAAG